MRGATDAVAFAVTGLVSFAMVWMQPALESEPVPMAPGEPIVVRPRAECPAEPDVFDEIADLQEQVDRRTEDLSIAQAQEEVVTGKALDWPDDLPEGFDAVAVEDALESLAESSGGVVVGIDCGEFPCVAVMGWEGADFEGRDQATAALREDFPGLMKGASMLWQDDEGGVAGLAFTVALLPDQELSQVERQRIDFRTDEAPSIFDPGEVIGAD